MLRSRFLVFFLALLAVAPLQSLQAQTYSESVLYSFPNEASSYLAGLIQGYDGNFYGTTAGDGTHGAGMVYRLSPSGTLTVVYSFCSQLNCADGSSPYSGLVQGGDGNFYGTTRSGGEGQKGTIFQLTPGGAFTVLHSFCTGSCSDGYTPQAALVQGSDGNFYGTINDGGGGSGSVFEITPSGTFTTLYNFCTLQYCADGQNPTAGLMQGSDGNLYGTTFNGGANQSGTVFKLTPGGTLSTVYSFCSKTNCTDGIGPYGGLVQGVDGNFYGTTLDNYNYGAGGGHNEYKGTVFKLTPAGALTTLYGFCSSGSDCTDGESPWSGLVVGTDLNFYGTTVGGGANNNGTVFKITPGGSLATIYTFCSQGGGCVDGSEPYSGLTEGSDGNLYGTTYYGGAGGPYAGEVYKIAVSPALYPPITLFFHAGSVPAGMPIILDWNVYNAFSTSAQQCYAFVQGNPAGGGWSGLQSGAVISGVYGGSATINPTTVGTFTYVLTCGGTESGFATLTVTGALTATALSVSPNPITVGQPATLKATVSAGGATPTGSVTFSYGSEVLHTAALSGGVATFTASTDGLPPGSYLLTAKYLGDSNYAASSIDYPATLGVAPTHTSLTVSPGSVTRPGEVTLTADVTRSASGAAGVPTGSVTFYADGGDALATVKLNASGVAAITASSGAYPAGTFAITAKYLGDKSDSVSTSSAVNVTLK